MRSIVVAEQLSSPPTHPAQGHMALPHAAAAVVWPNVAALCCMWFGAQAFAGILKARLLWAPKLELTQMSFVLALSYLVYVWPYYMNNWRNWACF